LTTTKRYSVPTAAKFRLLYILKSEFLADPAMNPTKYRPTVGPGQLSRATDYGQGGI